jgi:hypothetical protein
MRKQRDQRKWLMCLGACVALVFFGFLVCNFGDIEEDVMAADLSKFDAGNIISDAVMGDYTSMSESDIQNFLTSKNPCDNTNYSYYLQLSSNPNYTWHWNNGHFVCLSEERFGDGEVIGSGDTAAHIIWQAAQDYKINPKVLIVLLQKETGLITDPIPNNGDYRKATGYGCPDTAACSEKYYGFKNQVRNAASLFRTVLDGGWTNYPLGNNYIQYNSNAACGGSWVNVKNLATSALYRYTPYQPNTGALAAGYGTASCGAYGNRNFYLYFEDWFGGVRDGGIPESDYIVEGEYTIKTILDTEKVLNINENTDNSAINIQTQNNNISSAQRWRIKNNNDGSYTIINPATGKALDVEGAGTTKGTKVQLYASNNTCAQKWQIVKNDDETYSIYSSCSGLILDVSGGVANNGANINIWNVNNTNAQKWKLVPEKTVENGNYSISSKILSTMVLDIDGGVAAAQNGTRIQIYNANYTQAQEWSVQYDNNDGSYTIINPATGKALDVEGAGTTKGTKVQLYASNNTCAQKWQIVKNDDGTYSIYSLCSGLILDVSGGVANNGANINIWNVNNTNAQKWKFYDYGNESDKKLVEGTYTVLSATNFNKAIDISGGTEAASNGTNLQLWNDNNTAAQDWYLRYNEEDRTYTFINPTTKKALDVENGSVQKGANVRLWRDNLTCAQKWYILEEGEYYKFKSACSDLVLDVSGGLGINGANINLWKDNSTNAQKWKLRKK